MGTQMFWRKISCQKNLFRFKQPGVGGPGHHVRSKAPRVLEVRKRFTHQHQRTKGLHCCSAVPGEARGNNFSITGQSGSIQLPAKSRRSITSVQQFDETISKLVSQAPHKFGSKLGKKRGNVGRRYFKVGGRQRRLHPAKVHISKDLWNICDQRLSAKSGLLCKSRECPAPKIYQQMATQPSNIGKCLGVKLRGVGHGLCQHSM